VVATDASVEQVSHAASHPRIEYRVAAAEESGLDPASVDLVTVAAAVHWFDLDRFGAEVERVVRPGGVVAVWTYHVAHLESVAAPVLARFYEGVTKPYFAAGARLVDGKYRDIRLPGHEVDAPDFAMEARWSRDEILAFVLSWSGTQKYVKEAGSGAIEAMAAELDRACASEPGPHAMRWPLYLRVSRL
jgi:SAM-dependent methyltransferase